MYACLPTGRTHTLVQVDVPMVGATMPANGAKEGRYVLGLQI